ncbi:MAG: sugar phosphate isomerase/epimerase [Spirochaetes bacterium]|nr:sugar phosphate isomerase/epimerase [Spirochaetota bacterium]
MRNKVGIYYAYWARDWDADFVPYLARAASLGFDALEVNAGTIAECGERDRTRLKEAAHEAGLALSCCIGLPPSSDIASASPAVRARGIAHLGRIADAMADCGIDRLTGIIYSCWPGTLEGREGGRDAALRWSIASMKEAIKKAEDRALEYHVEVVNRFEQFLLNTAEEAVSYVREVGTPSLRVQLDTFHMNIEEDSFAQAIRTAGTHLGHFHVGETNRKPPGRGRLPWGEIGAALKSIGYGGWVVMEPFVRPGGEVGRDIKVNRDLMPDADLDAEARAACAFVKRWLD